MENQKETGDLQILQETVFNEKIVIHPKLGKIKLRMPTLEVQRKIDAVGRNKKKYLKEAKDAVTDESGNITRVPAYKSREQLAREYEDLGWWTETERKRLTALSEQHVQLLTELEVLGFESDINIYKGISECIMKLGNLCQTETKDIPEDVLKILDAIAEPGTIIQPSQSNVIKENSSTTEVDDLLTELTIYHKQYNAYIKLAQVYTELVSLQSQQSQLFSDSWQEQLQYFLRLAQVFYCAEKEDSKPIWPSLDAIESEQDLELIRWVFSELNAFWQGISDETRERMNKYSFMNPRSIEKSSSEDSPAPQESSVGGEQQVKMPEDSLLATATKDQLQTAKLS
jgi:hypothetical protein